MPRSIRSNHPVAAFLPVSAPGAKPFTLVGAGQGVGMYNRCGGVGGGEIGANRLHGLAGVIGQIECHLERGDAIFRFGADRDWA